MESTTKFYQLKAGFARHNNLLIYFVAKPLVETSKAFYLYGHGSGETTKTGVCCKCGRKLTHPVSVLLGIGPECGQHWHDWNAVGGYTEENLERLRVLLRDIKVEGWIPKSQIVNESDTTETVEVPSEHPMLKKKDEMKTDNVKTATMAVNKYGERVIRIRFPYNVRMIDNVRTLPGRQYHGEDKCWSAPVYNETLDRLIEWGFVLSSELQEFRMKTQIKTQKIKKLNGIPGLKGGELYPFQKEGVAFIEHNKGRALIADEMGLGKTIQALGWLQLHPEVRPAVIIVPASLKLNWLREIHKWMPVAESKVKVLSGTTTYPLKGVEIVIINYDILADWYPTIRALNPQLLITDECHYYKSNQARRTKVLKVLAKGIPHFIALSGTPIVNRPIEVYNAIRIIEPGLFPDAWKYAQRYCNARYNGFGWDFNGATNTKELHDRLVGSIMIRRLKKDVLKDLPDKVRSYVPMELTNSEEYNRAERNFIAFIRSTKGEEAARKASGAETLTEIETLKQLAVAGKLKPAKDWIQDFIDVDGKLVIFAVHRFVIDDLMKTFGKLAVKIDGSTSQIERQRAVDEFQTNNDVRLFVGNIQAAGIGITLTAASNVVFLELPWTPGALVQAEDRCHRIGQKDSVNIHYLLASGTIEEKIAQLIDHKRRILDSVLDGTVTEQESLITELIKDYANIDR